MGSYFSKLLSKEILAAQKVALQYQQGEYDQKQTGSKYAEIDNLLKTFYEMGNKIKASIEDLKSYIQNLKALEEANRGVSISITLDDLLKNINTGLHALVNGNRKEFFVLVVTDETSENVNCMNEKGEKLTVSRNDFLTYLASDFVIPLKSTGKISSMGTLGFVKMGNSHHLDHNEKKHASFSMLKTFSLAIEGALNNIQFLRQHERTLRLQSEIETTKIVQQALIPQEHILTELGIKGCFSPSSECGGDWYGVYPLNDHSIVMLIWDVTGHGTASAMVTATVKGFCDQLLNLDDPASLNLEKFFMGLNDVVYHSGSGKRLMTMCGVRINMKTGEGIFINAGHNHPFVMRAHENPSEKRKLTRLMATGNRLGYTKADVGFGLKNFTLETGDMIFMFTDGLVENCNDDDIQIGEKALGRLIQDAEFSLENISNLVLREYTAHIKTKNPEDDMTFLLFQMNKKTLETNDALA